MLFFLRGCVILILMAACGETFAQGQEVLPGDKVGSRDVTKPGKPLPPRSDFPATELGKSLSRHLELLSGVGKDAEQQYQASLARLRTQGEAATKLLFQAYGAAEQTRYFRRWAYLETVHELNDKSAFAGAARIALSAIPPNRFRSDPERNSVDDEIRIRVKAIEILGQLAKAPHAKARNEQASKELLKHVSNPHIGIRRSAIRGYLAAGGSEPDRKQRAETIRKLVKSGDRALITLDATAIRSVPHPDMPEKFEIRKKRPPQGAAPKISR